MWRQLLNQQLTWRERGALEAVAFKQREVLNLAIRRAWTLAVRSRPAGLQVRAVLEPASAHKSVAVPEDKPL